MPPHTGSRGVHAANLHNYEQDAPSRTAHAFRHGSEMNPRLRRLHASCSRLLDHPAMETAPSMEGVSRPVVRALFGELVRRELASVRSAGAALPRDYNGYGSDDFGWDAMTNTPRGRTSQVQGAAMKHDAGLESQRGAAAPPATSKARTSRKRIWDHQASTNQRVWDFQEAKLPEPPRNRPLLSPELQWVSALATGHDPHALGSKAEMKRIAVRPADVPTYVPGAEAVHRELEAGRKQRKLLAKTDAASGDAPEHSDRVDDTPGAKDANLADTFTQDQRSVIRTPLRKSDRRRKQDSTATKTGTSTKAALAARHDGSTMAQTEQVDVREPRPSCRSGSRSKRERRSGRSKCCFCPDPALFDGVELSPDYIGPFVDNTARASLFVHFECACWAPQVYTDAATGALQHVYEEFVRGRQLRCSGCNGRGATVGCYVEKCKKTFHFRCLESANARKVQKHFVAFCEAHAHLPDMESYKLMMQAAAIADVAIQRRDATSGLDAPHSKHTQLRRNQTEVVFSARAGLSSHTGAFASEKVLFSMRNRAEIGRHERLRPLSDRVIAVRLSALDIALGNLRLAHDSRSEDYTADGTEGSTDCSPAAFAGGGLPRESNRVFMVRNLRGALQYDESEIFVTCTASARARRHAKRRQARDTGLEAKDPPEPQNAQPRKRRRVIVESDDDDDSGEPRGENGALETETGMRATSAGDEKTGRSSGTSAEATGQAPPGVDMVSDGTPTGWGTGDYASGEVIVRLPLCERAMPDVRRRREEELEAKEKLREIIRKRHERQERARRRKQKEAELRKQASKNSRNTPALSANDSARGPRNQSAWELYVEEQLPNERSVRPDSPMNVSMRNLARRWSLLLPREREVYEHKSLQARLGIIPADRSMLEDTAMSRQMSTQEDAALEEETGDMNDSGTQCCDDGRTLQAGLFAGKAKLSSLRIQEQTTPTAKSAHVCSSTALNSTSARNSSQRHTRRAGPRLNDMFPTELDEHG